MEVGFGVGSTKPGGGGGGGTVGVLNCMTVELVLSVFRA